MTPHISPYGDIHVPRIDLLSLLFDSDWCLARENATIHVEAANPSNSITKSQARVWTQRIAHVLRHEFGIGSNGLGRDHVLVSILGSAMAPVLFYGLVAAGGVYCGASTDYQVSELVHQINDSNATAMICTANCRARYVEAAKLCNIPQSRILVLDPINWSLSSVQDETNLLRDDARLDWQRITDEQRLRDTTICLLYSSGTTGLPKGVKLSHHGLVANNICTMAVARRYKARCAREGRHFSYDTIAHLPMSNIAGITLYATNPFYMGGKTYWMEQYDFDDFLRYHRSFRPAYQFSVPPIWLRISKSDKVTDHFDGLQVAVTGSAPIGFATVREVQKKLGQGKCHMAQTWGATECAGTITTLEWPTYVEQGKWAVGHASRGVAIRFVDENGRDVEEGQPGELLVGGHLLAQGYHNRPDADRDSFVDGYYRTGDIGIITDGLIEIVDRKKELIKYKGAQVAPAELEALLTSHPRIADAAVIGIWDAGRETEVPKAYVVRQQSSGSAIDAEEIHRYVKSKVASHKYLRGGIVFTDIIPKSASGKILRKELRQKSSTRPQAKL